MIDGKWALFPSPEASAEKPWQPRTDLSEEVGRELHHIAKTWLRPDAIPAWEDRGEEWRALWAIHILRLLTSAYWGGARRDWDTACLLTMDSELTLRLDYNAIDRGLRDRVGLDRTHWEHLNAFDPWMDRLYWESEEFDPLADPNLPLPPHLRELIHSRWGESVQRRRKYRPRVRAARPGQKPPARSSR